MKRQLLVSLLLLTVLQSASARIIYTRADSLFVVQALSDYRSQAPAAPATLFFARRLAGRPYVAHTLERFPREEHLIVNTRQLDCTTLVETVVALTIAARAEQPSWQAFAVALERIRYRQGRRNGYTSRLHYFSDWIVDNAAMGIVSERQAPPDAFSAVQTISVGYMSAHPDAYAALKARPSLVADIRRQEQALSGSKRRYIPKRLLTDEALLRQAVNDGDILAIVTSKAGLDIAHLGFAIWHDDGLHLLNASQLHKKVIDEPMTLADYMAKHPSFAGIRVVKVK